MHFYIQEGTGGNIPASNQQAGTAGHYSFSIRASDGATEVVHTFEAVVANTTQAPQLAWNGVLQGATATNTPVTLSELTPLGTLTPIQATLQEMQLMGYKLEIARGGAEEGAGTEIWTTLAEQSAPAENVAATLSPPSINPALLHNGAYSLRLSAWDLAGRTTTINARIIIDSANKTLSTQTASDATYSLAGHDLALTRMLEVGLPSPLAGEGQGMGGNDFGNWTIPALNTHLSSDQPATTAMGATAPWQEGARVWLQIPASLSSANAAMMNLSFTLSTTKEVLGMTAGAPTVFHPVFSTSQGWTLAAHGTPSPLTGDLLAGSRPLRSGGGQG